MNRKNKFSEFLYDFFGIIIILLTIFFCFYACSDNVRSFTKNTYNAFTSSEKIVLNPSDTIKEKPQEIKDSVDVIKKDTTHKFNPYSNIGKEESKIDTVHLTRGNDKLYYFPVKINGIPMKFTLDTGCSSLSISIIEYLFMEHQGLIKSQNTRECTAILANGESEECFSITLDSLTIGKHTIKNVNCVVSPNQNSALLLGQDVLSKLGEVTIKYNKQILLIE